MKKEITIGLAVLTAFALVFTFGFGTGFVVGDAMNLDEETEYVFDWVHALEHGQDLPGSFKEFANRTYQADPYWVIRKVSEVEGLLNLAETYDQDRLNNKEVRIELNFMRQDMLKKLAML